MSLDLDKLRADLERDEGIVFARYQDSLGHWTCGIGHEMTDDDQANYSGPWSQAQVDSHYAQDIAATIGWLRRNVSWYFDLPEPACRGLVNMAFDLHDKLLGFTHMLACLRSGDYAGAADGELHSLWDTEVKGRADRIAALYRSCIPPGSLVA
jgi:lysozyme